MSVFICAVLAALFVVAATASLVFAIAYRSWRWLLALVAAVTLTVVSFIMAYSTFQSEDIEVLKEHTIDVGTYDLIDIGSDETTYVEVDGSKYHAVYRSEDAGDIATINADSASDNALFFFNFKEGAEKPIVSVRDHVSEVKRWCFIVYVDDEIVERQYTFTIPEGTVKGLPNEK